MLEPTLGIVLKSPQHKVHFCPPAQEGHLEHIAGPDWGNQMVHQEAILHWAEIPVAL